MSLSQIAGAQFHYLQFKEYRNPYEKDLRQEALEQFIKWSQPADVLNALKASIPKKAGKFNLDEAASHICKILKMPEQVKYDLAFVEIDRILSAQNKKTD
jgi:hypothetical protein